MLRYLDDERVISISGHIALTDGTTLVLSGANVIDYRLTEASSGGTELTVGDTRAASARMTIADEAHALSAAQLLGARVQLFTALEGQATPDPVGTWYIDDCDISRQSAAVSISGSDALATRFDAEWTDPAYPATLGSLFARVATLAGVQTASASFRNSAVSVPGAPAWPSETTLRGVLGYIAQCAGGFARMDRLGRLEIVSYGPATARETVTADAFTRLRMGRGARFAFNAVLVMETSSTEYVRYAVNSAIADAATNSIRIARNPLMTPTIATALKTALTGLEAQAVRMEWVGDPTVAIGDVIAVEDTDGTVYTILVTENEVSISGGMRAVTACELPSALESGYKNGSVFTPDGKLSPGAIADGTIEEIKLSAGARQAIVLEAGSTVQVGGTNLLKGTRQGFASWWYWMNHDTAFAWNRGDIAPWGNARRYTCLPNRLPAVEASYSWDGISVTGSQGVWRVSSAGGYALTATRAYILQSVTLPAGTYSLIAASYAAEKGYRLALYTQSPAARLGFFTPEGATVTLDAETACDVRLYVDGSVAYQTPVDITFAPVVRLSAWPVLIIWAYQTYTQLAAGQTYTVSTRLANYGQRAYFRYATSQDGVNFTDVGNLDATGMPGYADGYHEYIYTFTAPVTAYYRLGIHLTEFSGDIDLFDTWKLEQGNKATAWSPAPVDPASSISAGTTVYITEDEFSVSTPLFSVDTYSEEGYIRVSPSGVETGHLTASNVAPRYDGPAYITVNAGVASDGLTTFRALTDALAALSDKWLSYNVSVHIASDTTEDRPTLRGVYGSGYVTIDGGNHTLNGQLLFYNCACVFVEDLTIACAGAVTIVYSYRMQSLTLTRCTIAGNSSATGSCALEVFTSKVRATECGVYGVRLGIVAREGGSIYAENCVGSCSAYGLAATQDGRIGITASGNVPAGAVSATYAQDGGQIIGAGSATGGTTPVTPTATTTATFAPVATRTRGGASGWLTNTATMQLGMLGSASNNNVGAMWFDLSGLAGHTVQSASITMTRLKRFPDGTYVDGSSGAIVVYAETATVSPTASGSTGLGTTANQSEIGRWTPGATVTAALPPAAVQAVINGDARALVIYSTDTALVSGKAFSANYGAFAGRGESGAPVLSVTYT